MDVLAIVPPLAIMMPPATSSPPDVKPANVNARFPSAIVAAVCEYASPDRLRPESISMSFRWLGSMAIASKVSVPSEDVVGSVVPGVLVGPRASVPPLRVSSAYPEPLTPFILKSMRPLIALLAPTVKFPTVAREARLLLLTTSSPERLKA